MARCTKPASHIARSNGPSGLLRALIAGLSMLLIACNATDRPAGPGVDAQDVSSRTTQLRLPVSATGYYAVYMSNNVVLFGKLAGADDEWVTLTDVHYIRSNVDPAKKEVANQLMKRSGEWHQPNESAIARQNIVVIEPVTQDSRMMTLIGEMKGAANLPGR
jgi:hypothetical protein